MKSYAKNFSQKKEYILHVRQRLYKSVKKVKKYKNSKSQM